VIEHRIIYQSKISWLWIDMRENPSWMLIRNMYSRDMDGFIIGLPMLFYESILVLVMLRYR
jgi:hypothetical protein